MSCLCGDLQCYSCGPAQGNYRCPACNVWADEGCECSDEQIALASARNDDHEPFDWDIPDTKEEV